MPIKSAPALASHIQITSFREVNVEDNVSAYDNAILKPDRLHELNAPKRRVDPLSGPKRPAGWF
jgi:hypothetical protein